MTKVATQIVIDLELDEQTVNGTKLDLKGLSLFVQESLEGLGERGPKLRVISVNSTAHDWQITAQLKDNREF